METFLPPPPDHIKNVFAEKDTWSIDSLQKRLPYIRLDTIRQTLKPPIYIRVGKDVYTHIDNIALPEAEGEKLKAFIKGELSKQSYVLAFDLDLSLFEKLNSHYSPSTVCDAVFYKFLFDEYEKSGHIISKKGNKLSVVNILEQYCYGAETVTFEELNKAEARLDPERKTRSQCLVAGHNMMVRVNADLFVADNKFKFDIASIDNVLAEYCPDNFIPLQKIKNFSLFPDVGYTWNLFLLESYLRKFSQVFKYDARAVNSANAGVIVRKSFSYDSYDAILTFVLARSSL